MKSVLSEISKLSGSAFSFVAGAWQPFWKIRVNDRSFAIMKKRFRSYVVFSCIGTLDADGNVTTPVVMEYRRLTAPYTSFIQNIEVMRCQTAHVVTCSRRETIHSSGNQRHYNCHNGQRKALGAHSHVFWNLCFLLLLFFNSSFLIIGRVSISVPLLTSTIKHLLKIY